MRTVSEICDEIADMSPEEVGRVIQQILGTPGWTEVQKQSKIKFVLLISMIGDRFPKNGEKVPS